VNVPTGDAVWLADGLAATEPDIEPTLARGGFATVFLPAGRLSREPTGWTAREIAAPARAFTHPVVLLVVESDAPGPSELGTDARARSWGQLLWLAIEPALRERARFGRVAGVHLDVPFEPADPASFAAAGSSVRSRLPATMPLTVSLRSVPAEKDAEKWRTLAEAADGFVAFVFGPRGGAAPALLGGRVGRFRVAQGQTADLIVRWLSGGQGSRSQCAQGSRSRPRQNGCTRWDRVSTSRVGAWPLPTSGQGSREDPRRSRAEPR
jgi:hypothetical protein